jgi:hypothetical protein
MAISVLTDIVVTGLPVAAAIISPPQQCRDFNNMLGNGAKVAI